jgi:hypothetical protein
MLYELLLQLFLNELCHEFYLFKFFPQKKVPTVDLWFIIFTRFKHGLEFAEIMGFMAIPTHDHLLRIECWLM